VHKISTDTWSVIPAVGALAVSVVALIYAKVSASAAKRSADAARDQADEVRRANELTEQAHRNELSPVLIGKYVEASDMRDGHRPGVKVTNRGPLDLDRVEVTAIPTHRAHQAVLEGIYDPRTSETATVHETGALPRGESWTFDIIPARDTVEGGTAEFRCACHHRLCAVGGHRLYIDFPASPRIC
jgi:hypothetical protein